MYWSGRCQEREWERRSAAVRRSAARAETRRRRSGRHKADVKEGHRDTHTAQKQQTRNTSTQHISQEEIGGGVTSNARPAQPGPAHTVHVTVHSMPAREG